MTIRNPIEWSGAQIAGTAHIVGSVGHALHHIQDTIHSPAPTIRRIRTADIKDAMIKGFGDFEAYRSDVILLCVLYATVGLILTRLAFGLALLPLLFPLASGFAIVGPFASLALYEMSRMRERGVKVSWVNAFDVVRAPAFGSILALGLLLVALFLLWIFAAWEIYANALGTQAPTSTAAFIHDVFRTSAGHIMIVVGMGVGFLFALVAMMISVVSFPLLLDHDVGLDTAIRTSVNAVMANPGPMSVWGLIVAGSLALGSIPLFMGLVIVVPVLGHATWHLYRKLIRNSA